MIFLYASLTDNVFTESPTLESNILISFHHDKLLLAPRLIPPSLNPYWLSKALYHKLSYSDLV
jgi:hypothetical protein